MVVVAVGVGVVVGVVVVVVVAVVVVVVVVVGVAVVVGVVVGVAVVVGVGGLMGRKKRKKKKRKKTTALKDLRVGDVLFNPHPEVGYRARVVKLGRHDRVYIQYTKTDLWNSKYESQTHVVSVNQLKLANWKKRI